MSLFEFRNACNAPLEGKYARVQRLDPEKDYEELYHNSHGTLEKTAIWDYLQFEFPYKQPFESADLFKQFLINLSNHDQWVSYVVIDKKSNRKIGQANYYRISPSHKRAEVYGAWCTPELRGSSACRESCFLMMFHLFENLGYRRLEWRLNIKNIPSEKFAIRMGFVEEGVFRQHMLVNGKNRDTKLFSMLDYEWKNQKNLLFKWFHHTQEDVEIFFENTTSLSLTTENSLSKL